MYKLFEVVGVELEYMIVSRSDLKVMPIADLLIREMTGDYVTDVNRGDIAWSNELVSHVLELKTNGPSAHIQGLEDRFLEEVEFINGLLEKYDARLLPTGAHPFFDPDIETVIWPHEHNEVYALYDSIFGCKGHGWSNLQSTHLNLPFSGDEEFGLLHAAIRVLLPIIPAISASTPIIEGKLTGHFDTRMDYYRMNQQRIPSIAGLIIPEAVFTRADYERVIFEPIKKDIARFDKDKILDKHFLNSRGAIARFDRGAIEIRVIDIQECPRADMAILELIVASLKHLISKHGKNTGHLQNACTTIELAEILRHTSQFGSHFTINNPAFLSLIGMEDKATAMQIWSHLFDETRHELSDSAIEVLRKIIVYGNLSERMFARIFEDQSLVGIAAVYRELGDCLEYNRLFIP